MSRTASCRVRAVRSGWKLWAHGAPIPHRNVLELRAVEDGETSVTAQWARALPYEFPTTSRGSIVNEVPASPRGVRHIEQATATIEGSDQLYVGEHERGGEEVRDGPEIYADKAGEAGPAGLLAAQPFAQEGTCSARSPARRAGPGHDASAFVAEACARSHLRVRKAISQKRLPARTTHKSFVSGACFGVGGGPSVVLELWASPSAPWTSRLRFASPSCYTSAGRNYLFGLDGGVRDVAGLRQGRG